eukprot:403347933
MTQHILRYREAKKECNVMNYDETAWNDHDHIEDEDYTDVALRFKIVIWMYMLSFGLEFIRSICTLIYLKFQNRLFYNLTLMFVANDCLTIVSFIALHVLRLQYSGRYCSGDYASEQEDTSKLLTQRGSYLLFLIGMGWLIMILSSITLFCIRRV